MSAAITTKSANIDTYDLLGNASVIPWLGLGDCDSAEDWFYIPDKYLNQSGVSSRILRINITSGAVQTWKASGDLPPNVNAVCFNHTFTKLYCTADASSSIWEVDTTTLATVQITGSSLPLSALIRLPASGEFIGWDEYAQSLRKLTLPTFTESATWLRCRRWTIRPVVAANGDIYRAFQVNGPRTDGPLFHYRASHMPVTVIDASWTHNNGTSTNGPAHEARINATGLALNDDTSIIYFSDAGFLKKVQSGTVSSLGSGVDSILAMSRTKNKALTILGRYTLNIWS